MKKFASFSCLFYVLIFQVHSQGIYGDTLRNGQNAFGTIVKMPDPTHLSVLCKPNANIGGLTNLNRLYNYRYNPSANAWALYDSLDNVQKFDMLDSNNLVIQSGSLIKVLHRANNQWVVSDSIDPGIGDLRQLKTGSSSAFAVSSSAGTGVVKVFHNQGNGWAQKGTSLYGVNNSLFGFAMDILGDSLIMVGAPAASSNFSEAGSVQIFKWSGAAWSQHGSSINGSEQSAHCGRSVSFGNSNSIAIGCCHYQNPGGGYNAVEVRDFNAQNNSWESRGQPLVFNNSSQYGHQVKMTGANTVAITDPYYGFDGNFNLAGLVTISNWTGSQWQIIVSQAGLPTGWTCEGYSIDMPNSKFIALSMGTDLFPVFSYEDYKKLFKVYSLTLCQPELSTDTIFACGSFEWIDGNTYTSNNNSAQFTLSTVNGCDSVVTLDLTILNADTSVTSSPPSLEANADSATYQWIDCSTSLPIDSATSQVFVAQNNGSYAVVVAQNGCTDTSSCYQINNVGMERLNGMEASVFPNPSSNNITIQCSGEFDFKVLSIDGKTVLSGSGLDAVNCELEEFPRGQYTIVVSQAGKANQYKVILN